MASAARIAIFEREVKERLSRAALEALLARAEILSEGQIGQVGVGCRSVYAGSTMLTLDLGRVGSLFREAADAATARHLAELLTRDRWARNRIRSIGGKEAERMTGKKAREVTVEIRVKAKDTRVLIDVDVEAVL